MLEIWSRYFRLASLVFTLSACNETKRNASTSDSKTSSTDTICIGSPDAKSFAVYLHGVDGVTASSQELGNRKVLESLAKNLSMRIALPRASKACPNDASSLCWGWTFDERELDAAATAIRTAASSCFEGKSFGLVGFSNGGYLLTKMVRDCSLKRRVPLASWAVAAGSALFKGSLDPEPRSLSECGKLRFVTGTKDEFNFDPQHHLLDELKRKGADVGEVAFDGGHLLAEVPLASAIQECQR